MENEKMDKIKKLSLDMLEYFDDFCKKNDLSYSISYGTVLGAVRHGGFIPWDDDVDVDMPINDLIKLEKCWFENGDKEKYFFQNKNTDRLLPISFSRLRLNNTTWIDPGYEKYPIHWGVPIDIFPVYNSPKSKFFKMIQFKIDQRAKTYCCVPWLTHKTSGFTVESSIIKTRICLFIVKIISDLSKNSDEYYYSYSLHKNQRIKKDWLFPTTKIKFEDKILQGPKNPDKYLTAEYGDYMTPPPENKRGGHPVGIVDLDNDSSKYTGVVIRNK